jgi:hypothetical protein
MFQLLLLYLFFRQQLRMAGKGALSFGKSKARMLARDKNKVTFKDVAGANEAVEELHEIKEFLENPKKFQQGLIINSLTKEELSDTFTPIFVYFEWIRFNPRGKDQAGYDPNFGPGDVIWRSVDPHDSRVVAESHFGPNGEKPLATKIMNFFCRFKDEPMPVIVGFSNTSYRAGKQLLSLAKFSGGDMFARTYKLTSKLEKNDLGTYYTLSVSTAGKTETGELETCEALWEQFSGRSSEIKSDDVIVDYVPAKPKTEVPF